MRKSFLIAVIAASSIISQITCASAQTVNIQVFTDRTAWETAVKAASASATIVTEDFQGMSLQPGLTQSGGTISNGVLNGAGLPSSFKLQIPRPLHELSFNPLITAMGGDWDLSVGGPSGGLELDLVFHSGGGTQWQPVYIANQLDMVTQTFTPYKGFVGVVSDQPFQAVIYWGGNFTGNSEEFTLDNLSFVQSSERARTFPEFKFLINPKLLVKH